MRRRLDAYIPDPAAHKAPASVMSATAVDPVLGSWPSLGVPTRVASSVGAGGGPGSGAGVAVTLADAGPSPTALVATTVNVYWVSLVSPVMTHEVAPVVVQVAAGVPFTV